MSMRFLDRLLLLVAALVGFGTAAGLAVFLVSLISGEPVQTTLAMQWSGVEVHEIVARHGGALVGSLTIDHATLNVRAGGAFYRLAQLADILLVGGLWLYIILAVRRLVTRIPAGSPFSNQSVRQLRRIGFSLIVLNVWAWIRMIILPLALLPDLQMRDGVALRPAIAPAAAGPSAQVDASLSVTLLICGLIVLALAEAFRIGRDLRAETEAFV